MELYRPSLTLVAYSYPTGTTPHRKFCVGLVISFTVVYRFSKGTQ